MILDSGDKFMTIKVISVNILQFLIFCVSDKHEIADMGWSPADTRIIVRLPWPLLIKKWSGELLTIIVNNSNQRFPATAALIIRGKLDNSNQMCSHVMEYFDFYQLLEYFNFAWLMFKYSNTFGELQQACRANSS